MFKKAISQLTLLIVLITFFSCSKAPVACFVVDKGKTAKVNEEVQFDGTCSKNVDNYAWDFGDGTTGIGSPVKHKYSNTGIYVIRLTGTKNGETATVNVSLTINL